MTVLKDDFHFANGIRKTGTNREDQKSITISNSQCLHSHYESVCGERKSVHHELLDCPQLIELRQGLREKVGDVFNNMSTPLERPGEEGRGKANGASWTKIVEAVLDFAEASQGFQSRAPWGEHECNNCHLATTGPGEALSSLRKWYATHVHIWVSSLL